MKSRRVGYLALLSTTLLVGVSGAASAEGFVFRNPPAFTCSASSIVTTPGEVLSPEKQALIKCLNDYRAAKSQYDKEQTEAYEAYKKTLPAGPFVIGGGAVAPTPAPRAFTIGPAPTPAPAAPPVKPGTSDAALLKACEMALVRGKNASTPAPTNPVFTIGPAVFGSETPAQIAARERAAKLAAEPLPDVSHVDIPLHPRDFMSEYGLTMNGVGAWGKKLPNGTIDYDLGGEDRALIARYTSLTRQYSGSSIEQADKEAKAAGTVLRASNSGSFGGKIRPAQPTPTPAAPVFTIGPAPAPVAAPTPAASAPVFTIGPAVFGSETPAQIAARERAAKLAAEPLPDVSHVDIPLHPRDFMSEYGLTMNGVGAWGKKLPNGTIDYDLGGEDRALIARYTSLTRQYSGSSIEQADKAAKAAGTVLRASNSASFGGKIR